jgi:hypothetical protein
MLEKYPKIKYPAETEVLWNEVDDVVVMEKLDGANGRFTVTEDGKIVFGSRNVKFTENGDPLPISETNKQFRHAIKYLQDNLDTETFLALADGRDVTLFGECLHKHHIDYDEWEGVYPEIDSETPNFVLFDVCIDGEFVDYATLQVWATELDLETPQLVTRGSIDLETLEIPQSMYRETDSEAEREFDKLGKAEGVVLRRPNGDRAKIVSPDFKEKNAVSKEEQSLDSSVKSDIQTFVDKYITKGRVIKKATELKHEEKYDGSLEMRMMEDLHAIVFEDALDEAGEYSEDDFEEEELDVLHDKSASKTATLLQQELQR